MCFLLYCVQSKCRSVVPHYAIELAMIKVKSWAYFKYSTVIRGKVATTLVNKQYCTTRHIYITYITFIVTTTTLRLHSQQFIHNGKINSLSWALYCIKNVWQHTSKKYA